MVESIVIICDASPFGKNSAAEAVRQGAGFVALGEMLECKLVLMGDAVHLLRRGADASAINVDPLDEIIEMADLSELEIHVLDKALEDAGMERSDLIDYENLHVSTMEDVANFILEADATFRY